MKHTYDEYLALLKHEMVPALGCTDPIGIAFCAAVAASYSRGGLVRVEAFYSMNLIKNVAAVTIPKTNGLCGARIATAVGITGGNADKGLEALEDLTPEQVQAALDLEKSDKLTVAIADNDVKLYMEVTVVAAENTVTAIVQDDYTHLTNLIIDGVEQLTITADSSEEELRYDLLSLDMILDFAAHVPLADLAHVEEGIRMNVALSKAGMEDFPGARVGSLMYAAFRENHAENSLPDSAELWTAAGVDARMAGCPLPAMSNTGSGNQGIVCIMPVYGASRVLHTDHEQLVRATALSCLTAIYIKHRLGNLSTICGCTVACTGAACGITYLQGGGQEEMLRVLKNMFGNIAGLLCDGAKTSCALKAATCVRAACLASRLALAGFGLASNNGIVGAGEKDTIDYFVRTSNEGLMMMDRIVLDIIMNKESAL